MKSFRERKWMASLKRRWTGFKSNIRLQHWIDRGNEPLHEFGSVLRTYRQQLLKSVGALGLLVSVTIGGNQYVQSNTREIFHVIVHGQEAGIVSSPQVVDAYLEKKQQELAAQYPDVRMVLDRSAISLQSEKVFKGESDDAATLARLDELLQPKPVGAEVIVDGKVVAVVKDRETADRILEEYKRKYVKPGDTVSTMSTQSDTAASDAGQTGRQVESVGFVQNVEIRESEISPGQVMKPEDVLRKLETGDVAPTKYTVQEGDCVGCIAQKFGIPKEVIYKNNPWIQDDMIRVGDVLDLTVLQPTLSVKTVERITEEQEVQHATEYQSDSSLKAGAMQTITAGKNGLKEVELLVTKINGQEVEHQVVGERVLVEPVTAVVKRGTKVVKGEGSGKFSWPVVGASITSMFGMRWGKMHKGIDLTGNRNIIASDHGVVAFAGDKNDGYGKQVILDHRNGYRTVYAHLSSIYVKPGQIVEKGEKIGYMGATGFSTGVHLHFEIHRNGVAENPLKYLSR